MVMFTSKATSWGCKQEKSEPDVYKKQVISKHDKLSVFESGLVFNSKWAHTGASPDGTIRRNSL